MLKNIITKKSIDTFKFTYGVVSSLGEVTCSIMHITIPCSSKSKVGSSMKSAVKQFENYMEDIFNTSESDDFDIDYNPNPFDYDYFFSGVTRNNSSENGVV